MMSKPNPLQASLFTNGEELSIFTQSPYGTAVTPFVERETAGKQQRLFANDWSELAQAEQKKKTHKHFMAVNWWLEDKE